MPSDSTFWTKEKRPRPIPKDDFLKLVQPLKKKESCRAALWIPQVVFRRCFFFGKCLPSMAPPEKALEVCDAEVVRREVDALIGALKSAMDADDADSVRTMVTAMEDRVEELEVFFSLKNDDDDRAILFDAQRIRLRRALSELRESSSAETDVSDDPPSSPLSRPRRTRRLGFFETDSGHYRATAVDGVYANVRDHRDHRDDRLDFVDVQFVLTPEEHDLLQDMRRRRALEEKEEKKNSSRRLSPKNEKKNTNNSSSPYLNSATPYVDASRVEAAIYRPPTRTIQQLTPQSAPKLWQY